MAYQRKVLIIANPTSGRGGGRWTADGVGERLHAHGFEVAVRFTERRGDGERIAAAGLRTMEQVPDALKKYFKKAPQYSGDLD